MPQIRNFGEGLLVSITEAMNRFMGFLPALLGAIVVVVIGWLVSKLLARLVHRVLIAAGFERAANRAGISDFLEKSGTSLTPSVVAAELSKWFLFLIFVQAGANILGLPQLTNIINSIVLFIPRAIVALIIIVVGSLIANLVSRLVRGSAAEMGMANPGFLATLSRGVTLGFFGIAALSQLGVAPIIVNTLFIALVSSVALAFGLAFGLGGRDVASQITNSWYSRARRSAEKSAEVARLRSKT